MSFLAPLAFIGGLLAIPILLLYMLRLRRREVVVSSTYLWNQVVRDREANTPWQRLKRNLLLLLQLILLGLLVFALSRPFVTVPAVSAGRIALLLDASASMSARDGQDGVIRFEAARAQALALLDAMRDGDQMTIIRVAEHADVLSPLIADHAVLRDALVNARPGSGTADWDAALTLAAASAGSGQDFATVIISDGGGLQTQEGRASLPTIPGELRYIPIGSRSENAAITALATRSLPGEPPQLYAEVTNFGQQPVEVIFDLRVDDELFTAERYRIDAGESLPIVSDALPTPFTSLRAGLTTPADSAYVDYLALDDAAFTVPASTASRRVLIVSEGNRFLEQVFRSLPGVNAFGITPGPLPRSPYDLYVFDGWLPDTLPNADLLIINPPQGSARFTVGDRLARPTDAAAPDPTANIQVDRADARMAFLDFSGMNLLAFRQVTADWADALISADGGPLLLAGDIDGRQAAIFTFDLRESDLPLQIAFPILIASLVDWFAPQGIVQQPQAAAGDSVTLTPPPGADAVRVTAPDGTVFELPATGGSLLFTATDQLGLYTAEARQGETVLDAGAFAINLFDAVESAIAPHTGIQVGSTLITPETGDETGQREFWPLIALIALAFVVIEWIVYHRRRSTPARVRSGLGRPARTGSA